MIAQADQATGALRLMWLDDAATAARNADPTDLCQDVTRTVQSAPDADQGLAGVAWSLPRCTA
jgi:hypothetical protein